VCWYTPLFLPTPAAARVLAGLSSLGSAADLAQLASAVRAESAAMEGALREALARVRAERDALAAALAGTTRSP
jgi:hypothetical protein